eukprot:Skav217886  [mRNA]  locus=scaffold67:153127:154440:+ [translate_table: standard]
MCIKQAPVEHVEITRSPYPFVTRVPRKSRNIKPGKVETVFHGTSKEAAKAILKEGFNPSKDGLLGKGVYVTTDPSKAKAFAGKDGDVLRVAANLGHVQTVDARAARKHGFSETAWHKTHDAAFVPQGGPHCMKGNGQQRTAWPQLQTANVMRVGCRLSVFSFNRFELCARSNLAGGRGKRLRTRVQVAAHTQRNTCK